MFGLKPVKSPQEIDFFLVPYFSMIAFTCAIEPLRTANRLSGQLLYKWRTLSVDHEPVQASNGITLIPDNSVYNIGAPQVLFVCAGLLADQFRDKKFFSWLQQQARRDIPLGGICTGSLILARAGLLDDHRCTIHWENVEGFAEEFPGLDIMATLFEIDHKRFTCSGGIAPLDMMINSIAMDHGEDLAIKVAEQMLHNFVRHPHDTQRMSLQHRTGISHPKLLAAIAYMEAYLENPYSLHELSEAVGLSSRQLERLFKEKLGKSPSRYYLELRLERARLLLRQTSMPVLQVAIATGFTSAAHFSKCYRDYFKRTPSTERQEPERFTYAYGKEAV